MSANTNMTNLSAVLARRAEKKAKREEKGKALGLRKPKRPKAPARKRAFALLKNLCREFVLRRAKWRNAVCEVGIHCGGAGPIQIPYHVFAAKLGNAIKYDERNILGACSPCNFLEYISRKRGDMAAYKKFDDRHKAILGEAVYNELAALAGRKQISTVEAMEMAQRFKTKIEAGDWK